MRITLGTFEPMLYTVLKFYDTTTITYNELEHAQSKQYLDYPGVVNEA